MEIEVNNITNTTPEATIDENIFFSRYPDAPDPGVVEVINLNLKTRQEALDILSGKTKVIYRHAIPFYDNIIYNTDVDKWIDRKVAEGASEELLCRFLTPIRFVLKLHLSDYRDTWYVDVNLSEVGRIICKKENLAEMNMRFGCKELLQEAKDYDEIERCMPEMFTEEQRPKYYYFVIENIYDTNLVNSKAYNRQDLDRSVDEIIPFLDE